MEVWHDKSIVWMDSDIEGKSRAGVFSSGAELVGISRHKGWNRKEVDLSIFPEAKGFVLIYEQDWKIENLERMGHLEYLWLAGKNVALDLRPLKKLKDLIFDWGKKISLPKAFPELRFLSISNWLPGGSELPESKELSRLQVVNSAILSAGFTRMYPNISELEFAYCRKLLDISDLKALERLEKLSFLNCKKISSYEAIGELLELRSLKINDCSDISSLVFLVELGNLKEFRCIGTAIQEEDLSVLKKIETVAITKKRNYKVIPDNVVY